MAGQTRATIAREPYRLLLCMLYCFCRESQATDYKDILTSDTLSLVSLKPCVTRIHSQVDGDKVLSRLDDAELLIKVQNLELAKGRVPRTLQVNGSTLQETCNQTLALNRLLQFLQWISCIISSSSSSSVRVCICRRDLNARQFQVDNGWFAG